MNVTIDKIVDHGHDDERIVLDVLEDDQIGNYLVLDTTYLRNGEISNKMRHPFWFPDNDVKKGDIVVLYTKRGTDVSRVNTKKTTSHFFYWNLDNNVWNNDGDCALLLHVDDWESHRVTVKK